MSTISTDIGMIEDQTDNLFGYYSERGSAWAEKMRLLAAQYKEKYGSPAAGSTRVTFFDRATNTVIKLPRHYRYPTSASDVRDENVREAEIYKLRPEWPLAACWLEPSEFDSTVEVLRMERVETTFDYPDAEVADGNVTEIFGLPEWCGYLDSQQVGMTAEGRLVSYDYPSLLSDARCSAQGRHSYFEQYLASGEITEWNNVDD